MTSAFYFGQTERPLFGIHHEPALGRERGSGVVLCYPLGQEYIRSHRSFLKLAVQLARAGFHVLRFDFHGCGDSSGGSEACTLGQCADDVGTAVVELRDAAGIDDISLIGLRLGANVAARAGAASPPGGIRSVVLWEPVLDGHAYLAASREDHREWLFDNLPKSSRGLARVEGAEILGFPLAERLRREIEAIDLLSMERQTAPRALLLGNGDPGRLDALQGRLQALEVDAECRSVAAPSVWLKEAGMDQALVPNASLQCIVSWMEEAAS